MTFTFAPAQGKSLGTADDIVFADEDGVQIRLFRAELVEIEQEREYMTTFGYGHVRSTSETRAIVRLRPREDGAYAEIVPLESTPIYDALVHRNRLLDAIVRIDAKQRARFEHMTREDDR